MDYDLIVKIVTGCAGIVGVAKIFYEFSIGRRSREREEYKFARDFLEDVKSKQDLHPFLKDKGYRAIAGDSQINADEVEYLLSLTRPERALRDYVLGRAYLEHFPQSGNLQIKFKKKYERKWSRQWRMTLYLVFYIVSAFAAVSPWLFASYLGTTATRILSASAVTLPVFGFYAWLALRAGSRIYRATMLVNHQHRHTQKIVIPEQARGPRRIRDDDKTGSGGST
jgi:hypothetical protein